MAETQIHGIDQIMPGTIDNSLIATGADLDSAKFAPWSEDRDAGGFQLTNLSPGSADSDAVTVAQLADVASGMDWKGSARVASTANVVVTYNATGGASGRGQITAAPDTLDGVSLAANDRILLKDQTTGAQKGIWVVSTLGTGSNGVWDRATDFDEDFEVTTGALVAVEEGTVNAGTVWMLTTANPITIGGASGTALTFTAFGTVVAGNGMTQSGSTLNVVSANGAIVANANDIAFTIDGTSLEITASGAKVRDAGITSAHLNTSVAGNGIGGGGGSALFVDEVQEAPSGTINGVNLDFTISSAPVAGTLQVWKNGILLRLTDDYTFSGTTISFLTAPKSSPVTSKLWARYLK